MPIYVATDNSNINSIIKTITMQGVIEMLYWPRTIKITICHYIKWLSSYCKILGRVLECQKCAHDISVVTQVLVLYLPDIYALALG